MDYRIGKSLDENVIWRDKVWRKYSNTDNQELQAKIFWRFGKIRRAKLLPYTV